MKTVIIRVASQDEGKNNFIVGMQDEPCQHEALITFPTWEVLYKALSPKRMHILKVMAGAGELSFRDVAARVQRDVKAVHTDITLLLHCGIVERGKKGLCFPYSEIRFDFTVSTQSIA